jgi:hypothetical protein
MLIAHRHLKQLKRLARVGALGSCQSGNMHRSSATNSVSCPRRAKKRNKKKE